MTIKSFSFQHTDFKNEKERKKKRIGRKIAQILKEKDVKSYKLAEIVGIHKDQMSRYKTGKHEAPPDILKKIAEFGGKTLDYFYEDGEKQISERADDYKPDMARQEIHNSVNVILDSGDPDIIKALTANIKVFLGGVKPKKDKRNYHRTLMTIPVDVKILGEPETPLGVLLDASQMGFCVYSSHQMQIGEKIDLEILFNKNSKPENFRSKGQIIWKKMERLNNSEIYRYGVKVLGMENEGHGKLESLLKGGD